MSSNSLAVYSYLKLKFALKCLKGRYAIVEETKLQSYNEIVASCCRFLVSLPAMEKDTCSPTFSGPRELTKDEKIALDMLHKLTNSDANVRVEGLILISDKLRDF
ncbi:hypothetical protein AgCh_032919 [Apium graveolens]